MTTDHPAATTNRETNVYVRADDGTLTTLTEIADIAEVAPGRLQVGYLSGDRELIGGQIFGASGAWKLWLDAGGSIETHPATGPLTMPNDAIRFRSRGGGGSRTRAASIKRLKRADLPTHE